MAKTVSTSDDRGKNQLDLVILAQASGEPPGLWDSPGIPLFSPVKPSRLLKSSPDSPGK